MDDQQQTPPPMPPQIPKNLSDQIMLLDFVDAIIKEKNDPDLKPEILPILKETLLDELNDQLNAHMIGLLDEKGQIDLDNLLDKNVSDAELDNFFTEAIPDIETQIAAVLINFRTAFLTTIKPAGETSI